MTVERDPGMDRSPDEWASPEINPTFPEVGAQRDTPDDERDPYGTVHFADAGEMHDESITEIRKQSTALARLVKVLTDVNKTTLRIDAGQTKSFSMRLRVRWIILSRATAGDGVLTVGTETFTFTVVAAPIRIDLPLVIENGTDISFAGDGRMYLIADPE